MKQSLMNIVQHSLLLFAKFYWKKVSLSLMVEGFEITVEKSIQRIFKDDEFEE
jgi:hypothetical protein